MRIEDLLAPENVLVGVNAPDKTRLLGELSARAGKVLGLDGADIARELEKREQLGSTGVGGGIALPHARFTTLDKPFGLLARMKRPLDFDSVDGGAVDMVFLLLQPAASLSDLNALASVARALRDPERLQTMRAATSAAELYRAVARP